MSKRSDDGAYVAADPVLKTGQSATYTNSCEATVLRAARRGDLRGMKVGRVWRFRQSALDAWLAKQVWPVER